MIVLILLAPISFVATLVFFLRFLVGKPLVSGIFFRIIEVVSMIVLPLVYANFGKENRCCGDDELDTATFSPSHQLTIAIVLFLALAGYFYSSYRKRIATPVIEVFVNTLLLIGFALNIFVTLHTKEKMYAVLGNIPVFILFFFVLTKNYILFLLHAADMGVRKRGKLETLAYKLLAAKPVLKFSLLFVLCLPVMTVIACFLLLFGQKPDSIILAFTETYKHGFSQWDHQCDNVQCGGHYLCSVAANGHRGVVKPKRFGRRNGGIIVCNRQLLVANAFEELIQENLPFLHRVIRERYNKVGDIVHRYYFVFEIKLLSDTIYFLMKPLEWFFVLVLYTFDMHPENRIAKQYLSYDDKRMIEHKPK